MTKIEPLTKQEHRWRKSKRIPKKIAILSWHRWYTLNGGGCLRLGMPKEDLPLFQSTAMHWNLFNVSDLLDILDRCITAFISFKIFVCGPSEFAATWHHTTDNYTLADLQLRDIVALLAAVRKKPHRHWDRAVWFPHFLYHIIFLMLISPTVRNTCACADKILGTR